MKPRAATAQTAGDISRTQLARNFALLGTAEIFSKAVAIVAFAYLARTLGPAEFGTLELALAVMTILALVVDSGLSPYGAREIGKERGRMHPLAGRIVVTRLALLLVAWTVLLAVSLALDQAWAPRRVLLLYGLPLIGVATSLAWVFQGRDAMGVVAGGSALRWVLFGAGIAFMVGGPGDTWKVPVAETVAVGGMTVFYAVMFRVRFGAGRTGVPAPRVGTLLRETLPIGASELTWALRVYFATVALGVLVGGPELGWFGGAHRIVLALHTFVWLYFFNVLPSMARTSTRPRGELGELIGGSLRASAWVAVFVGAVVTALAEPIVTVLYGSAYEASAPVLRILVWLVPVAMVSGHYRYILIGYGHQTLEFGAAAVGAAVAAIVAVLTIRPLGTPGVAAGLVASELAVCAVAYGFVRRKVTWIPLIRQIWKPAAAGAGLAAVLAVWPPQFGWSIAVVATIAYWSWAGVVERGEIRGLLTKCRAAARPRVV